MRFGARYEGQTDAAAAVALRNHAPGVAARRETGYMGPTSAVRRLLNSQPLSLVHHSAAPVERHVRSTPASQPSRQLAGFVDC
jgi:hypothetical protein